MIPFPIQFEELETIYSNTFGADHHSVAITSAERGEGVSMIAYALARRAAAAGRRTLLVDLNTANPTVASRLGLEGQDWSPTNSSVKDAIIDLEGLELSILSAPQNSDNILESREDDKLRKAIASWREDFDCVVLDTSPLTKTNQGNVMPDMAAACCNSTVFVVLAGRTAETKVTEANLRLQKAGAHVVGAVINDRHNPNLTDELCRETRRADKIAPKLMRNLRDFFRVNAFLMQKI
jgi:Mrp family chromosome partitioning ATPase